MVAEQHVSEFNVQHLAKSAWAFAKVSDNEARYRISKAFRRFPLSQRAGCDDELVRCTAVCSLGGSSTAAYV